MATNFAGFIGRMMGGYRLERIVGNGSTGAVFLGRGAAQQVRAVKVLLPPGSMPPAAAAEFRRRFNREEQAMRRLRHPNILFVEIFGEDTATGSLYMVMPYVATGTLADKLMHGPLPFNMAIHYLRQLASAVDYANQLGIIHRDIKPGNILIDAKDQLFLTDFGIVKLFETRAGQPTTVGTLVGTPEYMAPEQARGERVTRAADIYSVGMVAYHLLTGRMAFQSPNLTALLMQIAQNLPPKPREIRPEIPEAAQEMLLRSLAKHPGQRFATAMQFVEALDKGLRQPLPAMLISPAAHTAILAPPTPRPPQPVLRASPGDMRYQSPPMYPPPPAYPTPRAPSPPTPRRRGRVVLGIFLSIVLLACAGIGLSRLRPGNSRTSSPGSSKSGIGTSIEQASPPATFRPPTIAPPFTYRTQIPGICGQESGWFHGVDTLQDDPNNGFTCSNQGMILTNSRIAASIALVRWVNPYPNTAFTAGVEIGDLSEGCAGIGYRGVSATEILDVCANGTWYIRQYPSTLLRPSGDLAQGTITPSIGTVIDIIVTNTTLKVMLNGNIARSIKRPNSDPADSIVLVYDDTLNAGACLFRNFLFKVDQP